MNFLNMEFIPLEKSTSSNFITDVTITNEQLQECTFDGSYEATISTSEQQSDNLFTVNGLDCNRFTGKHLTLQLIWQAIQE